MTIGQTVKLIRSAAGLKQKDLAEQLGASAKYLSMVENDRREPSLSFLRRFASQLGVPLSLLFVGEGFGEDSPASPDAERISAELRNLILTIAQTGLARSQGDVSSAKP